ncbi:MAG: 23S rRNA (guanosine(2251)-2'-O)-methyltransferase RlmB [Candidatus Gastranaerophilales bacterium]|nr:23S rRNA (guanosine(2251)-2'-O)-methyltransferase RlmB [Candidatus Gastranaerophilales bacterium]
MKNYIFGKNAVLETLLKNPKRINKIYISKNIGLDNRLKKIKELALNNSVIIQFTNLNKYLEIIKEETGEEVNLQGVVASVSPVEYIDLDTFLNRAQKDKFKKLVILDGVSDPHNFGAIIRTATAAGYDGILVGNHRACPVTPVVEKTSAGAVNHIPIIKANSLSGAIDYLKNNDWWIIALDMNNSDNYFDVDYKNMNFALVLGAEGDGISKTLLNKADFKIKVPTHFESLNVSACAAVVIYETIRQTEYT